LITLLKNKGDSVDLSLTTPYGPPAQDAYILEVPNDCVGLVIGKGGETIKRLQDESGAKKVQVAADSAKGSSCRNVFVEGDKTAYFKVKQMLQKIVDQQRKIKSAQTGHSGQGKGQYVGVGKVFEMFVPDNLVGLIIGKGGETIKGINRSSGAIVFIPKEMNPDNPNKRLVRITGNHDQIEDAKGKIDEIVQKGKSN